eukprot:scaffold16508_cov108-Isochrysis_galbana.AAC.4
MLHVHGGAQLLAQLAPHRLYVLARYLTPPKGVWESPRALIHLPRNTRWRLLSPPDAGQLRRNLRQAVMMPHREVGAGAEEACQVATRESSA